MFKRIRELREDNDLTQKQVSQILNCSQQVYSNYELGQRDIPTDILIQLSSYYNVSADYILGIEAEQMIPLRGYTETEVELVLKLLRYFDEQH